MHAGECLDQGRLAGAVVAQQAMHFAALEPQGDAVERDDLAEILADVFEREDDVVGAMMSSWTVSLSCDTRRRT